VKKLLAAAVVLVLVIGGAVLAVPLVEKRAADQIKSEIERDGTTTVGTVEVSLLNRRILLTNLQGRQFGEITIGRWQASGIAWPLEELIRGHTPMSGLQLGDPLQADRLELDDLHVADGKTKWSVGSLVVEGIELERYDPPPADSPNSLTHLGARIARALSMAHLEQKDAVFTDVEGNRVAVGTVAIGEYDKGRVGSIGITGIEVTPRAARAPFIRVANVKLANLDLQRVFTTVSQAAWRPGMPVGRVDLDASSVTGFSGEGLKRYGISLGSISSETKHEGQDVRRSSLRIQGFVLAPPLRGLETLQLRIGLTAMGLKDLRLDLDCSGTEDRGKAEVSVDRCALTGPELGEIDFAARLVGADAAFWKAVDDGDGLAFLRTRAALSSAKLAIVDHGLVERSLRAVATTTGQPLAAVRAGFAGEVRHFQPPGVLITEDMTKLLDTIARFVETGGTLTIEAKPETPIGLDKLDHFRRPGPDLVNMMGLGATLSR
jgi:hypothetical protein